MPFTPTHILAVVPFAAARSGWLPFAALAIGAMVPDIPIFLPDAAGLVGWSYGRTHSVPGLISADLPLGLIGYLVFVGLLRRPLVALLPDGWQSRCADLVRRPVPRTVGTWLRVAAAVVLGAATHLLWDSFTHRGRWGVELIPWLDTPALRLAGRDVPGYKVAQYGSTLVGLPVLATLAARWLQRQVPRPVEPSARLLRGGRGAVLLALVAIAAGAGLWAGRLPSLSPYERLGRGIAGGGLALGLDIVVYAIGFEALARRAGRGADRAEGAEVTPR